jgi:hypothetical protein
MQQRASPPLYFERFAGTCVPRRAAGSLLTEGARTKRCATEALSAMANAGSPDTVFP